MPQRTVGLLGLEDLILQKSPNDGFYLQYTYDVYELVLKQSPEVGAVIISLTQRSTLRHREVRAAEMAQLRWHSWI